MRMERSVIPTRGRRYSSGWAQARWSVLVVIGLTCALASTLGAAEGKPLAVIQGTLEARDCPLLKINGREETLTANRTYLLQTLQDKRLDGREIRLEGVQKPDGSFEAHWLFTVKDGKLFRVRYFCSTCNIVALGPGNCVCCQQPTELQEVPYVKGQTDMTGE